MLKKLNASATWTPCENMFFFFIVIQDDKKGSVIKLYYIWNYFNIEWAFSDFT